MLRVVSNALFLTAAEREPSLAFITRTIRKLNQMIYYEFLKFRNVYPTRWRHLFGVWFVMAIWVWKYGHKIHNESWRFFRLKRKAIELWGLQHLPKFNITQLIFRLDKKSLNKTFGNPVQRIKRQICSKIDLRWHRILILLKCISSLCL